VKPSVRLRVVSFNDVYSLEHLPQLKNLVRHAREVDPADALLVVVAGDFLAPSLLSSLDAGRAMVACLNDIGVTHVVLGNHEDDIVVPELRQRIAELHAVWLGTNVSNFEPRLPSHDIVTLGAHGAGGGEAVVRVGLVGIVMTDAAVYRAAPFGGATLSEPNAAAIREARRLIEDEKCDCVLPVTHQPLADDRELARAEVSPRFPAVIGGHEHELFLENVEGTWLIKAGMDALHAAVLDLGWDEEGTLSTIVRMESVVGYAEDLDLRARIDAAMVKVHALESATLYAVAPGEALSSVGNRARQTTMGTLVCNRLRDALGAEAAIFNGGGIRASRDYPAHLTYGDIKAELPFDNEVIVARIPGRVLAEAIATSRAAAPLESGGFLQVDDRIRIEEPGHVVTQVAGAALDPDRDYSVATVRDLLTGMDHIEPFVRWGREHPERVAPHGSGREVKIVLVESFALSLWRRLGGFDAVDENHDNRVSAEELAKAIARVNNEAPSSIAAQLVLQAIDTDRAGAITRQEVERIDPGDE
jgi:2',3'-cyclic-nucleotide 2'-phosphodiesterase (5'-nucleotidase family)